LQGLRPLLGCSDGRDFRQISAHFRRDRANNTLFGPIFRTSASSHRATR
jgi:hypothetical protein